MKKDRKYKKKVTRSLIIGGNILLVVLVLFFIFQKPANTKDAAIFSAQGKDNNALVSNPLDQLASAEIALTVSKMTNLPEKTAINNQADSQKAELAMASSTTGNIIAKPEVISTGTKSVNDIKSYVVQSGDTLVGVASKFGVTSDSISWSNNLSSAALTPGTKLVIPPLNGIVYTVKSGDTAQSLASKYGSSATDIISFNNDDISGLIVGQQIVIPNGTVRAVSSYSSSVASSSWAGAVYGYNGYDYGYCTWYVASQIPVPSNWGNASTWAYYARMSGWNVSSAPSVGAIAQTPYAAGGLGHVAIVIGVNGDQVQIKDMNGIAGWGRVGTGWQPVSKYPNYISR